MIIKRISKTEFEEMNKEDEKLSYFKEYEISPTGFREVIDALVQKGMPMVTHNGFIDMFHVSIVISRAY